MNDYSDFDFKSLLDEKHTLEKYFSDVYSKTEINDLLKIYTIGILKPRYILKKRDFPVTSVMIIVSGSIGVYHYPNGIKTLFRELQSKEIIGDFELNFIASRAAQYETLGRVTIMKFPKMDYERVTYKREVRQRSDKIEYLYDNYDIFANMQIDKIYRLSKFIKQRTFKK